MTGSITASTGNEQQQCCTRGSAAATSQQARELAPAAAQPVPAVNVCLADAASSVLPVDLEAKTALPGFDTAAMDGYAVAGSGPFRVIIKSVFAGQLWPGALQPSHPSPATGIDQRCVDDIRTPVDLERLLTQFYGRAFTDSIFGPVFVDIARMDLNAHLPRMIDFWSSVLFGSGSYRGNPLPPHQRLHRLEPLTPESFERWLEILVATVDEGFAGPKAEHAKLQARRIASSLLRRVIVDNRTKPALRSPAIGEVHGH